MLRGLLFALAIAMTAAGSAFADPPPAPNPYLEGPADAPGPGSLAGTRWRMDMSWDEPGVRGVITWVQFRDDGVMLYGSDDGMTYDNARWRQRGAVLVWDTNAMFSTGLGYARDNQIRGTMTSVRGRTGQWTLIRDATESEAAK